MFYVTERWHDVVATAVNPPATPQSYEQALAGKVRAAVTTMAAVAAARLGRYAHAIDLFAVGSPHQADNPYLEADAARARAWSERGLGNPVSRDRWFEQAEGGGSSDSRR